MAESPSISSDSLPDQWSHWLTKRNKSSSRGKKSSFADDSQSSLAVKPFRCSIYDLPLSIIFPVVVNAPATLTSSAEDNTKLDTRPTTADLTRGMTCSTCRIVFDHRDEQLAHYKTEFHRNNLIRKMKGESPLSQEQFRSMSGSRNEGDLNEEPAPVSSESDDSEKEAQEEIEVDASDHQMESLKQVYYDLNGQVSKSYNPKHGPMFHFTPSPLNGWTLSFSSALFTTDSPFADSRRWFDADGQLWNRCYQQITNLRKRPMIAVFILRSGRFAGAIFDHSNGVTKTIAHKVFRRYTVRAKAGGGQSSYDNKGGKARSMGAQLRRYGEKALEEDVQKLITLWQDYLENCGLILVATTKTMRPLLFEKSDDASSHVAMLKKEDSRVVSVPFAVDKPTLETAEGIYQKVVQAVIAPPSASPTHDMYMIAEEESLEASSTVVPEQEQQIKKAEDVDAPEVKAAELPVCPPSQEIIAACESLTDEEASQAVLQQASLLSAEHGDLESDWSWEVVVNYPNNLDDLSTPLHIASRRGLSDTVEALLTHGANPEREDVRGRTAYLLAATKETRNAFRKARAQLGDESWDWNKAGVPDALTDEKVKEQKQKEKEKKKRAQQRKKDQKARDEQAIEEALDLKMAEEVALEIEKQEEENRLRDLAGYCVFCGKSLYKQDFYDVMTFRCCSTDCVAKLRRQLAAEAALQRLNR